MAVVFLKSRVKGYFRKDGTYVRPHATKTVAQPKPVEAPKKKKAATAQWPGWNTKAPLALDEEPAATVIEAPAPKPKPKPKPKKAKAAAKTGWPWPEEDSAGGRVTGAWQATGNGKATWPNAVMHPHPGEDDKPFQINEPSAPSAPPTWTDPDALATFVPGGQAPTELNGVALAPWVDHPKTDEGWEYVVGQMPDLEEPPLKSKGKAAAAGVVIEEPDGRVWMVKPSNAFAGYVTTFPKGHVDEGHSLQATAIKEAFEESGMQVEITGFIGDVERTQTVTRYYRARRVGGTPTAMGWETQAVMLAPPDMVHAELNRGVDRKVASAAGIASPKDLLETVDDWEKVGAAKGSNPGGFYEDPEGQEWYVKVPKSAAVARNEVLAAKLYQAASVAVPDLKLVTRGGHTAIASKIVPGLKPLPRDPRKVEGVMDGFAVDAWLANWDVVGLARDNLLADPQGHAMRVDVGGALVFRAQGEPKGKAFGKDVGELETLTNGKNPQSATVFGGITHDELQAGIARVASVPEETIRALCEQFGPGDAAQRAALADTLIARRAALLALQS